MFGKSPNVLDPSTTVSRGSSEKTSTDTPVTGVPCERRTITTFLDEPGAFFDDETVRRWLIHGSAQECADQIQHSVAVRIVRSNRSQIGRTGEKGCLDFVDSGIGIVLTQERDATGDVRD